MIIKRQINAIWHHCSFFTFNFEHNRLCVSLQRDWYVQTYYKPQKVYSKSKCWTISKNLSPKLLSMEYSINNNKSQRNERLVIHSWDSKSKFKVTGRKNYECPVYQKNLIYQCRLTIFATHFISQYYILNNLYELYET